MRSTKKLADATDNVIHLADAKGKPAPQSAESLLTRFCPDGKVEGGEFVHPDPLMGGSIKFSLRNHLWKNWSNDLTKGKGVETFIAHATKAKKSDIIKQIKALGGVAKPTDGEEILEIMVPPRAPTLRELSLPMGTDRTKVSPTATWGYRSATGELLMVVARYPTTKRDGTPDKRVSPWVWGRRIWTTPLGRPCDRIGWHAKGHPSPRPLYGQEWLAKFPDAPVIVCEGEKAADVVPKLFKGYIGVTSSGGAKSADATDWSPLRGRELTTWPDNDEPGLAYAQDVSRLVQAINAASIRQVEIPGGWPEGWDLADDLPPGVTPQDLRRMLDEARRPKTAIEIEETELHRMVDRAEAALIASGEPVFQRGSVIVRPATTPIKSSEEGVDTITASLSKMSAYALCDVLSRVSEWFRVTGAEKDKIVLASMPRDVAMTLLSRQGKWTLPPIAGIISCPTIRPDGTLLTAKGYDQKTRLYHEADPSLVVTVKDRPSKADALEALKTLEELYTEVAFVDDVSKSVALANAITLVCRGAMSVVPLTLFRAHTSGTGKTFLVNIHSNIATGRNCPVISVADKPEETEKRITGALLGGYPLVSLDNVNGEIKSDLLCQAVEQELLRLRPFGTLDMVDVENRTTFVVTGNNAKIVSDLVRRSLLCDLDAVIERPDQREFKQDPIAMVRADRGKYVSAILTIARAYVVAGYPGSSDLSPMSSYKQWSKFVRGPLVWLGQPDPALSVETGRADDPELSALETFIAAFDEVGEALAEALATWAEPDKAASTRGPKPRPRQASDGFSTDDLVNFLLPLKEAPSYAALGDFQSLLKRMAPGRDGSTDGTKLGRWLSRFEGRVVGIEDETGKRRPLRIVQRGKTRKKAALWAIEEPKAGERRPLSVVTKRRSPRAKKDA